MVKKPSILSFTPPTACTKPNWSMVPVIAIFCGNGKSDNALTNTEKIARDALSPSISP